MRIKNLLCLIVCCFGGLALAQTNEPCNSIPLLNQQIIQFVKQNIHKKVDRGECWDLAAGALNKSNAKWDGKYEFGKKVGDKECVYPGDIIQFKNVELKYKKGEATYLEKLAHHTAIIYEVKANGVYIIADQNTRFSGRKVGTHELDISTITKGTIQIYRPQN